MGRPILVTGHHRSGSTWVGEMLVAASELGYIHEPFNPTQRPGICEYRPNQYFTYVPDSEPEAWRRALTKTLSFRYSLAEELRVVSSAIDVARMARDAAQFTWCRVRKRRPLMKDPIALFSAEWVANTFDASVIVLIRHPAAFVSSLLRLGWTFPFGQLLRQPLLMDSLLAPYAGKIEEYAQTNPPPVDQAILGWIIFNHVISKYQERQPAWKIIRLEDVARSPHSAFKSLYSHIGINYSNRCRAVVDEHSRSSNPEEVSPEDAGTTKRNSRRAIHRWKHRLDDDQIHHIRQSVENVATVFYGPDDW